jgi:hypothetical protein
LADRNFQLIYFLTIVVVRNFTPDSADVLEPPGSALDISLILAQIHIDRHPRAGRASEHNARDGLLA